MKNPANKLSIDFVRREALNRWGFVLIDTVYVNNAKKMAWLDTVTGNVFTRSWAKLISGETTARNANNFDSDKQFFENYKGLGYKLSMTREEYMNAPTQSGNKIFHITHPDLQEPWDVKKGHFKTLAETHLNSVGKSLGELFVESILVTNKVSFEEQVRITFNNQLNIFDFYLPDYNTYIEYDGKQHYLPIKHWGGEEGLKLRNKKDREKDTYVKLNKQHIIRIPYTVNTMPNITEFINKSMNTDFIQGKVTPSRHKMDIVSYASDNTLEEAAIKYNISITTVKKYCKQVREVSKR